MASVFVKDGRLVLQMRVRGIQLREALHLRDTAANRKWAEGECAIIERELVIGNFDYWRHFPNSRSQKAEVIFPKRPSQQGITTGEWMVRWLSQVKPRWGSGMAYDVETMINRHIVPSLGPIRMSDLSTETIGNFVGVLRECPGIKGRKMGAERINKILKVLRRSLKAAIEAGYLPRSPMSSWTPLRVPKPEMWPFRRDEFKAFLNSVAMEWRPYFEFAVWTGLRPGEQAALQWTDVNLEDSPPTVEVRATLDPRKTGMRRPPKTTESSRGVELIPEAVKALMSQREKQGRTVKWVFAAPSGGSLNVSNLSRRIYYPALKNARLSDRPLYNVRHTFAVFMLEAGENPGWIARQMGHTSTEMLWRRYARYWPQLARSDGGRVSAWWNAGVSEASNASF